MKLLIDIPEEVYKSIQDNDYCGISNADMYNAVKNGTPIDTAIRALKNEQSENVGMCQQNVGEMSEKQTDGDLISRQAVLKCFNVRELKFKDKEDAELMKHYLELAFDDLAKLPSEEKTAEWITKNKITYSGSFWEIKCSNCGKESDDIYNYCPNCGVKMKGENNGKTEIQSE